MKITKKENYNYQAEKMLDEIGLTSEYLSKLGSNIYEVEKNIKEIEFSKPENSIEVDRLLTPDEIKEKKERILEIQLNELPELQERKAEIDYKAKLMMKEAADLLNAKIAESRTNSEYLKNGLESDFLDPKNVFRFVFNGFFIWILADEESVKVVKIQKLAEDDQLKWDHEVAKIKSRDFFELSENRKAE